MDRGLTLRIHKAVVVCAENTPRLLYKTDLQFISDIVTYSSICLCNWIKRCQISLQVRRISYLFFSFCWDISRRISGSAVSPLVKRAINTPLRETCLERDTAKDSALLAVLVIDDVAYRLLTLASRRVFEDAKRHGGETSVRCSPASPAARKTREQKGACHANYERERERERVKEEYVRTRSSTVGYVRVTRYGLENNRVVFFDLLIALRD